MAPKRIYSCKLHYNSTEHAKLCHNMFLRKLFGNYGYKMRQRTFNLVLSERKYNDLPIDDIPEVSTVLIKKTLKANNITYEEGFTCFIAQCPLCGKNAKSTAKIYINKTTGTFMCSFCKRNGHWGNFEMCLSSNKGKRSRTKDNTENDKTEIEKIQESLDEIRNNSMEIKILDEDALICIFKKFKLPVVSKSSFDTLDVRINDNKTSIYFPLENVDNEIVGYRKIHSGKQDEIVPSLVCGGILTARLPKSKETAVLVPNISDFLVLLSSKVSANIVCLPNGVNNLSQYVLPSLERFKKLILWFGSDSKSWDATRHFAKKLGEKRCLLVRPNEKQHLPHLNQNQDFKSIISNAQPMWHKSITNFHNLRTEVFSDLLNIDKVQGVKWKRYPALNKILKGHRRGELTVFTGPTGSGKTTFISDYSLDLAMQGVNTLWGSFEIRNARLARTMLQQMSGLPLDENLHIFDHWADQFEKLPIYFMTFHGQQSIKVVMEAVEHATYIYDIAHLIIDNVQFMMGMSEEQRHMDRFWKQDVIIAAFRQFATRKNCHVTLVIHPRKERDEEDLTTSSIFGGAKASQEADNVLIIQDKRLTSVRGKKYLQVAKNRYSGDLGIMALDFDKNSLSYQQKKPKPKKTEGVSEEDIAAQ